MKDNLDFDGMAGNGVNRAGNKYSGNKSGMSMKMNYGNKTFKGNASDAAMVVGPSVTGDKLKKTMATASQGKNIGTGYHCPAVGNADKINVGSK